MSEYGTDRISYFRSSNTKIGVLKAGWLALGNRFIVVLGQNVRSNHYDK
jgi:hypothetical protein